jgi:hypothetical protein
LTLLLALVKLFTDLLALVLLLLALLGLQKFLQLAAEVLVVVLEAVEAEAVALEVLFTIQPLIYLLVLLLSQ